MAPSPPTLAVEGPSPTPIWEIRLSWTAVDGASFYSLYVHTEPITALNIGSAQKIAEQTSLTAIAEVTGIDDWYFAVTASDDTGESDPSNSELVTTVSFLGPGPALLTIKAPYAATFEVELRWSVIDGAKEYKILRHTEVITPANEAEATVVGIFPSTVDKFTDRAPVPSTYYYRATAVGWDASEFHSSQSPLKVESHANNTLWYVNREFVAAYCRMHNPDFQASDIPDQVMESAFIEVNAKLTYNNIFPSKIDLNKADDERTLYLASYLGGAMLFHVIDLLIAMELIAWSPGLINETQIGPTRIQMQRAMPMFFFAKGVEDGFFRLIATETPRMKAWWFMEQFAHVYLRFDERGEYKGVAWASFQHSVVKTIRAPHWNHDIWFYASGDLQRGVV